MTTLFINLFAFGTILSSIFTITSKNPVISVIFLISTFVQAALYLLLIGLNFVGISYIVIYVGAIAVLFLFVIMMINIKLTDILETGNQYTKNLPLAIAIGFLFIFIIFQLIPFNFNNIPGLSLLLAKMNFVNAIYMNSNLLEFLDTDLFNNQTLLLNISNLDLDNTMRSMRSISIILGDTSATDLNFTYFEQIEVLGHSLYTHGAVLLITLSVILLLSMFATIILSRTNKN